ncbi:MAG: hypothetical protein C4B58_06695 [Deltaproteobacteria bacterium]|nr:MAG: hypothetical protein C4B58_06695 [Deltaproteobacteria bacterium]
MLYALSNKKNLKNKNGDTAMIHVDTNPQGTIPYSNRFMEQPMRGHQHHPHYHGFCRVCGHPVSKCICGLRSCRKEAKELLVKPSVLKPSVQEPKEISGLAGRLFMMMNPIHAPRTANEKAAAGTETGDENQPIGRLISEVNIVNAISSGKAQMGQATAVIGGGCCVHLSIEYMQTAADLLTPQTAGALPSVVVVYVMDSEGTVLGWGKIVQPGYHIKEGIISTNPGAQLIVVVLNAIARVRWCEVFSC